MTVAGLKDRAKAFASAVERVALCAFRKWWRPTTCVIAAGTVAVNGIYIPLKTHQAADLTGLAAVLAALAPFAIARTAELIKGRVDDDVSA
jgi:hypothetical protein